MNQALRKNLTTLILFSFVVSVSVSHAQTQPVIDRQPPDPTQPATGGGGRSSGSGATTKKPATTPPNPIQEELGHVEQQIGEEDKSITELKAQIETVQKEVKTAQLTLSRAKFWRTTGITVSAISALVMIGGFRAIGHPNTSPGVTQSLRQFYGKYVWTNPITSLFTVATPVLLPTGAVVAYVSYRNINKAQAALSELDVKLSKLKALVKKIESSPKPPKTNPTTPDGVETLPDIGEPIQEPMDPTAPKDDAAPKPDDKTAPADKPVTPGPLFPDPTETP